MPRPLTLIGVVLAVGGQLEVWVWGVWRGPRAVDALVAAAPLLLAVVDRAPLRAGLSMLAAYVAEALAFGAPASVTTFFAVTTLIVWTAAVGGEPRRVVVPAAVLALGAVLASDPDPLTADELVFPFVFLAGAATVGALLGRRTDAAARERVRAERLLREQDAVARAAVLDERLRIARELHDVVAHAVSVMVVQTVAARKHLRRDVEVADGALAAVEGTGQEALSELRRLLGVLRGEDREAASLVPQPGLDGVEGMVARATAAGLDVALRMDGERRAVPHGIELSAYRIVQEALTNALKHAPMARTDVRIGFPPERLVIEVTSGPGAPAVPAAPDGAPGHGLAGMRERVSVHGGALDAGPTGDGGFRVRAWLPT